MDFKSKFYTIFKALNPYNYSELVEHKFFFAIKYYLFIIIFSVLVMSLLFVPMLYSTGEHVAAGIEHFENLTVSSNFALKDSFNVLTDPVIRFDNSNANMTNELVLITPETVSYKHYLLFGSQRSLPITRNVDVTSSARAKNLISLGFFFLLPSLFFWAIIFSIAYFTAILCVTYLLVLLIAGSFRVDASLLKLLKLAMYSITIYVLLQLLLMPFFRVFILPLAAYWILVLIILFLWKDHPPRSSHHGSEEYIDSGDSSHSSRLSKSSKTSEIFGDKSESGFKSKHKSESGDSYDVDERGNLKGSSKKHHHSEEDDDGYVEL